MLERCQTFKTPYWDNYGQGLLFVPLKGSEDETYKWKEFKNFDAKNPHIWEAFQKETFRFIKEGYTRIGAHLIIQIMRWRSDITNRGSGYKIKNDYFPYYSRKFMIEYPSYNKLFELRPLKR